MTDFKLPELPSDEELGITDEDREALPEEEDAELSEEERRALGLGDAAPATPPPPPPGGKPPKKEKKKRPPEAPAPRSRWRGPAMLAGLALATWMTSAQRTVPDTVPANAADTVFSSARAMAMDVEITRQAHPTGSPAEARVRDYILGRLRDVGLDPQVRTTTAMRVSGRDSTVIAATVRNIVARIPGTQSTGAILLVAHYDGAGIALGAGDDGAGVVSILEAVRALRAGAPLGNDVVVLITDGEELGLLGAKAFVADDPWMADVQVVLNVEMRGGGGPSIMFETGDRNGWIVRAMRDAGIRPWASSFSYEIYKRMPNDTDFTRLREAGLQGLNFAGISRASVYHQTYDDAAHLSEAVLQHHGDNILGMTRFLGAATLTQVDAPDVTYFTLPAVGVVVYPGSLVWPIAAWAVLLGVVVLLLVRRAGGRWPGVVVGLGLGLVSMSLTGAVGWGLIRWLPRFHPEYGGLIGSAFHHEGWYVVALLAAGLCIVSALFGLAGRWLDAAALTWGALLIPLIASIYLAVRMPGAAVDVQWPLVAAYLGTAALLLRGARTRTISWGLALVTAIPALAFLTPTIELIWLGLSFSAALHLGILVAFALLLLLPALNRMREPNGWWAPLTFLVAAAAFVGLGIRAAAPTPEFPAPSTLAWSFDRGTGEALWMTRAEGASASAATWAAERTGSRFTDTRPMTAFGYREGTTVAPAQAVDVPPLEAWVLADSTAGPTRHMRLALRSAIGAELLQLRFPRGGATRLVGLNDRALPVQSPPARVDHWGDPEPALMLDLELPQGAAVDMDVVEHLLRPGELVGAEHFVRPPGLAPNVRWMSDRAMVRTPAAALALQYGPPPFAAGAADTLRAAAPDTVPAADTMAADTTAADTTATDVAAADTVPRAGQPLP